MKLVDRALKYVSQTVLREGTGLTRYQIQKLKSGDLSRAEAKQLNSQLREFIAENGAYGYGKATGVKQTKATEVKPEIRKLSTLASETPGIDRKVKELKEQFPRFSKDHLQGMLEYDVVTRQRLRTALNAYHDRKDQVQADYARKRIKSMSLDDYVKKHTKTEYKALSKAFNTRRVMESRSDFKKLISRGGIDLTIENYGRGKGKWHSVGRL